MCAGRAAAAVAAFASALGGESHKDEIRVLGVSPGPVVTERAAQVLVQGGVAGSCQDVVHTAFGREWASPEQIAGAVSFVASSRASYFSGTVVNVDLGTSRV
jgi:3-oxoacyl-[acyl-carrier protein] reductase